MVFGVWGRDSAGEEQGGLRWEFAQPLSAQPAAEDMGEKERPALLDGPSLRNGVEPMQGVADHGDGLHDGVAVFVLQAHFDGALAAVRGESPDAVEQRGPAGDGFAMMLAVVKPRVEVPPVVEQRDGSPALPTPSCPFRRLGGWPSAGRAPAFG